MASLLDDRDCDSLVNVTKKNPFPGMNPFFEQQWRDAHASLLMYLRDALQERLPADLVARTEEEVIAIGAGRSVAGYRPDVQVREPWTLKEPSDSEVASIPTPPPTSEPIRVRFEEAVERWVEIHDEAGRLITVLELLSPSNKVESVDRDRYLRKRRSFICSGVNLVEIDLVRQGIPVFPESLRRILHDAGACYGICVFRAVDPEEHALYPIQLRERLPVIRVPLRAADSDVVLDLQTLIDQCHERGRYHLLNYHLLLNPPLSADDAAWSDELLRRAHLV
jgi:hypothetical protein